MDTATRNLHYLKLIEEAKETMFGYVAQTWPITKRSSGVEISSHQFPGVPVKIYKAVGEIEASPAATYKCVVPPNRKCDPYIKSEEIVEEIDEKTFILHTVSHSAAMGFISPRDYVDLVRTERNYDGGLYFTCVTSVDYPLPEDPSLVRGWNYPSGILCYPVEGEPEKTWLVYIVQSDAKGLVPLSLVNAYLPSAQVDFFYTVRSLLSE